MMNPGLTLAIALTSLFALPSAIADQRSFTLNGTPVTLDEVTGEAVSAYQSTRYVRVANAWNIDVCINNTGTRVLPGPIVVVVESYSATTGPLQPDGLYPTTPPRAYYDFSAQLSGGQLWPGEKTALRTLVLGYTNGSPELVTRVYARLSALPSGLAQARSLNEYGQPLPGVTVVETGPLGSSNRVSDAVLGLVTLGQGNGTHTWQFTRTGYTPVWRRLTLNAGDAVLVPSPRLTPRTAGVTVPLTGSETTSGAVRVTFAPGAVAQSTLVQLTPLTAQTLPAFLPTGWSPLQAFWLDADYELSAPVTTTASLWDDIRAGETAVLARWNSGSFRWDTLQLISGNGTNRASFNLPGRGAFAVVVRDTGTGAPSLPQIGQPLPVGSLALPIYTTLTAGGRATPGVSLPSRTRELVTATALVAISNQSGALPSGVPLRCEVREDYRLSDGSRRRSPAYENFIIGYRRPAATINNQPVPDGILQAAFPMQPLLLFGAEELDLATVTVDVLTPGGISGRQLDAAGGQVTVGGVTLIAASGDLDGRQIIQVRKVDATNFIEVAGYPIVCAFDLSLSGVVTGRRLVMQAPFLPPNSQFVLARVLAKDGLFGWEPVERLVSGATGGLVSAEPATGQRLPGVTKAGQYLLLKAGSPLGLVSGIARNATGQPTGGLPVRIAGQPWLTFSGPDGSYQLLAPAGAGQLSVMDPATGDTTTTSVTIVNPQVPTSVDLTAVPQGPRVISITPTHGAVQVPRVTPIVIEFSEAINPAALAQGIRLLNATGGVVQASVTLNLRGTIATLLPSAQLSAGTNYTVMLATTLADLTGSLLEGPRQFTFTTERSVARPESAQLTIFEPGATNIPANVRSYLVAYDPKRDRDAVVAFGSPGTAEAEVPVVLVNETTGETSTVLSKPDGSFGGFVRAGEEDFVSAVFVNGNGTRTTVPASRQKFDNGKVGLYRGGGILEAESDGGPVQVIVEPGGIDPRTRLKLNSLSFSQLLSLLGNVRPPSETKVVAGFTLDVEGFLKKSSTDVRVPVRVSDLEIPTGVDPSTIGFALVRVRNLNGVEVFEIRDKMELEGGFLVTHSPPYEGVSNEDYEGGVTKFLYAVIRMRVVEPLIGRVVVQGKVLAVTGSTGLRPVPGATVLVGPADLELISNGQLAKGSIVALADAAGSFVSLYAGRSGEFILSALSPRFPNQIGRGSAEFRNDGIDPIAIGDAIFGSQATDASSVDSHRPRLTLSHSPQWAITGSVVTVRIFATDDSVAPDVEELALITEAIPGKTVLTAMDVQIAPESPSVKGFSTTRAFQLRANKPGLIRLVARAIDKSGNIAECGYTIEVHAEASLPAPEPTESDDITGPFVVDSIPRNGVLNHHPLEPLHIQFSEPIRRESLLRLIESIQVMPSAGTPFGALSDDRKKLEITLPSLKPATDYSVTISPPYITDNAGNVFDQDPHNNTVGANGRYEGPWDAYNFQFRTVARSISDLPGIAGGGGIVAGRSINERKYLFAIDRIGFGDGTAGLVVYSANAQGEVRRETRFQLPDYPRDLVFVQDFSFASPGANGNLDVLTKDILVVAGGIVGIENPGQWVRAIDVSIPSSPEVLVGSILTRNPASAVTKLAWSPPVLGYLESGAESTSVGLIDLQLFLYAHKLNGFQNEPPFGDAGLDKNADGDYVDFEAGDRLPRPKGASPRLGVVNGGLVDTVYEDSGRIQDFALAFGGRFIALLRAPEQQNKPAFYQTARVGGQPVFGISAGRHYFETTPDRLLLLFGVQVDIDILEVLNLALVSGGKPNHVSVLDITDPIKPALLTEIEIPTESGSPKSAVLGGDGKIYLSTAYDIIVLDPSRLGHPSVPNASHPAITGVLKGIGGGARSFAVINRDLIAVNLGGNTKILSEKPLATPISVTAITVEDLNEKPFNLGKLQVKTPGPETKFGVGPDGTFSFTSTKFSENFGVSFSIERGSSPPKVTRRSQDGFLEVVTESAWPNNYVFRSSLDPDSTTTPTGFPNWTLDGARPAQGASVNYEIPGIDLTLPILQPKVLFWAVGLPLLQPQVVHMVRCGAHTVEIMEYPAMKATLSLDLKVLKRPYEEAVSNANEFIKLVVESGTSVTPRFEIAGPEGKIEYSHEWKECPSSNKAFYTFDLKAEVDPIGTIRGGVNFKPPIPALFLRYVRIEREVNAFLGLGLSGSISGSISRSECGELSASLPLNAKVSLFLEVNLSAGEAIEFEAKGDSSITLSGQLAVDEASVKLTGLKADWDGLKTSVSLKLADGLIEYTGKWELIESKNLYQGVERTLLLFNDEDLQPASQ